MTKYRILDYTTGWETVTPKQMADCMKELRAAAVQILKNEQAKHVIYATKEYSKNEIRIRRIAFIICNDEEFEVYVNRQTADHVLKAVHTH
ncbi:hypothetical protein [Candidatus Enterococcus clewellii]|uniref:Uncharacterized protein n=1 Tax=Candidatus Enterococcus clewellii TaxID=1834193 RepID=A0A242K9G0_9ENTE|nr:hypothetical protein [Enterococcus sp. 9E7_DIV0242]OTP17596.1 hypothetical protein A5888_001734 [Enterococcus sp. 9E7_DIV0242]